MSDEDDTERVVGADRVLAVLVELAQHADGVGLDELAHRMRSSKPTVHRALASLRRAGLADQVARGVYRLGDEYLRLAFQHQAARPEGARLEPVLRQLAERYGETAHYAVLEGSDVVYRAKVDPPAGSVRLTSQIGGRNPAYLTAVGKLLLSRQVASEAELHAWLGDRPLEARTPRSITSVSALWTELARTRERGFGIDDQENEVGINCVAVPAQPDPLGAPGAVSISALAFRLPLERLIGEVPRIRAAVETALDVRAAG
ncbi:MAG: IclR family transcriptional regulator, acetate operon repressor [Microbacteriaceae bacterium]|nr:IclR family transcriptional regulator, acetate operon repressor [Microbacteriaceae bacterium]